MTRIERSIDIEADTASVWSVVADLDAVAAWNPNVTSATCGAMSRGVGATRTCELSPGGWIEEVVSDWVDGERLWFAIGNHGGIRSADMGVILRTASTGTTVTAVADYHLAFGPLGPVIDQLKVKRQMVRMLDASLAGLKEHVEAKTRAAGDTS